MSTSKPAPHQTPADAAASANVSRAALVHAFARTLGHELRNRVNATRLSFSVVRLSGDERRAEALAALDQSLRQLEESVAFATSIAMAQARAMAAEAHPIPLSEVLAEVSGDLGELEIEPPIELRITAATSAAEAAVDAATLRLALYNLVASAVKRVDRGKSERWVEIRVGPDGASGKWRVDVEDNGVGLPGVELAIGADSRTAAPMGRRQIEIELAQEAVARLGGRLWVESNGPGRGTALSFTLDSGVSLGLPSGNS